MRVLRSWNVFKFLKTILNSHEFVTCINTLIIVVSNDLNYSDHSLFVVKQFPISIQLAAFPVPQLMLNN